MTTADLKQTLNSSLPTAIQDFATAKELASKQMKALGIEDAYDLATRIGYVIVGAYALVMLFNLATLY